jgi:hypothetical protein
MVATRGGIELVAPTTGAAVSICSDLRVCGPPAHPSFSPNGQAIAFVDTTSHRLVVVAPDGSCLWCLPGVPLTTLTRRQAAFTPGGDRVTVTRNGLWSVSLTGGGRPAPRQLARRGGCLVVTWALGAGGTGLDLGRATCPRKASPAGASRDPAQRGMGASRRRGRDRNAAKPDARTRVAHLLALQSGSTRLGSTTVHTQTPACGRRLKLGHLRRLKTRPPRRRAGLVRPVSDPRLIDRDRRGGRIGRRGAVGGGEADSPGRRLVGPGDQPPDWSGSRHGREVACGGGAAEVRTE